jgi:hypothetical protein
MRKIEPTGMRCPEGYEYVHGHDEKGIHVRAYCRKISMKRIKVKFDMRYPGNTTVKASVREGFRHESGSYTVPTDSLFGGEEGKQLQDALTDKWMGKDGKLEKKEGK